MAITEAALTSGSNGTDASSFDTASITPAADQLIIAFILNTEGTAAGTPTLSGNGLTWVQIDTQLYSSDQYRITMFRAMGASPSAGAITIDFGGATQESCTWSIFQFDGIDTSGTNGSGAVVQSAKNTGSAVTSLTVTLAAFGSTDNGAAAGFGLSAGKATTPDTGWTEIHEVQLNATLDSTNETQWRADNDTTAAASFNSTDAGGIAIEIKAAGGAPAAANPSLMALMGVGT